MDLGFDPLTVLGMIGSLVKCPICHELFDAPVFFSECGHVFCSACISAALRFRPECPVCRSSRAASVSALAVPALDKISNLLRTVLTNADDVLDDLMLQQHGSSQPASKRARTDDVAVVSQSSQSQRTVCEHCGVSVRDLSAHATECLGKGEEERERFARAHAGDQRRDERKKLAKLHYGTMTAAQIKRVCEQLGLATTGDKQRLEWRHSSYRDLHNANMDRAVPKRESDVKAELRRLEAEKFAAKKRGTAKPDWKKLVEKAKRGKEEAKEEEEEELVDEGKDVEVEVNGVQKKLADDNDEIVKSLDGVKEEKELVVDDYDDDDDDIDEEDEVVVSLDEIEGKQQRNGQEKIVLSLDEAKRTVNDDEMELELDPTPKAAEEKTAQRWKSVFSNVAGRMFYFDRQTKTGSFLPPKGM